MTQNYERESMPERQPDFKWSVLEGELPLDGNFPDEIPKQDLTAITKGSIDPKEVPLMQAFGLMQERRRIKRKTRHILDAIALTLYLRQEIINQE